jgi:uncharacterized protein YciI
MSTTSRTELPVRGYSSTPQAYRDAMEWICRIRPTRLAMLTDGGTPEEQTVMGAHFERLRALADDGVVVLAGPTLVTDERNYGVIVFRADDEDAARQVVDGDPAIAAGVMEAELLPFRISLLGR